MVRISQHTLLRLLLLFALLLSVLQPLDVLASGNAAPAESALEAPAEQQPDLPYFPETGYGIANAQFADYFAKRGGVRTFGYPVSRGFQFLGTDVQFFQRQIMQIRPDGLVGTLNILDADLMPYTRINGSEFPAGDATLIAGAPSPDMAGYAEKIIDFVMASTSDTWEGQRVNFGQTFSNTVKYEEAFPDRALGPGIMPSINLELWGIPTSRPAADPSNGGFVYQRYQRGIMHYDAATGATQGLLLADYLKAILTGENLPPDLDEQARTSRFYRQYDPRRPGSVARPLELPGTDMTGAFVLDSLTGTSTPPPVAVPARRVAPAYDPARLGYGMAAHLYYQDKGRVTRLVNEAGFGWIKQQVRWSDVERVKGQPDFSELDGIIDHALAANLNIMFSVVTSPAWSRADGRADGPPDNYADFAAFMGTLASRYKDQVRTYEVWNEQNFSREWGGGTIDAGQYVELLKLAYPAIKAADPNAIVLTGALTPTGFVDPNVAIDDVLYFEQMYQYQGGIIRAYSDGVAAHAGGFNNPPEDDPTTRTVPSTTFKGHWSLYFRRIEQLRDVMVKYGDASKRMWLTEFGWSTANFAPGYEYGKDNSETDQANYLLRAFQLARTRYPWMGVMFVWNLNFATMPDLPYTDEKPPFAILNPNFTPRPAYLALRAMPK
ncbi:MAG: cellulase family glycosylhydrolase [Chloroflexi bacterium]|nr:cellulase family glycosylhydrolase [Chloroflexota bacterium]